MQSIQTTLDIIKKILTPFLSGVSIISFIAIIVNIDKFLTDDYFIQKFYTNHSIKLIHKILIPIKYLFINILLTFLCITSIVLYFFKNKETRQNFNLNIFIEKLHDKEYIKNILIVFLFISVIILGIQFIFTAFFDLKINNHFFIKHCKLYVNSNDLNELNSTFPKNKKIYLLQKFKQNKQPYFLTYYIHNKKAHRIIISENKINEIPIHSINKRKIFIFKEEFNRIADNKFVLLCLFVIAPIIVYFTSSSLVSVIFYYIEIVYLLFPTLKNLKRKHYKKILKSIEPRLKTLQKRHFYLLTKIYSLTSNQQIFNKFIDWLLTFILIFTTNIMFVLFNHFANFIQIKKWLPSLLIILVISIILAFIFIYITSEQSNKE